MPPGGNYYNSVEECFSLNFLFEIAWVVKKKITLEW